MERKYIVLLLGGGISLTANQLRRNYLAITLARFVALLKKSVFGAIIFIVVGLSSCKKEIVGPDNNSGTPDTPTSEYIVSNLSMSIPAEGGRLFFLIQDYGYMDGFGDKRPCRRVVDLLTY